VNQAPAMPMDGLRWCVIAALVLRSWLRPNFPEFEERSIAGWGGLGQPRSPQGWDSSAIRVPSGAHGHFILVWYADKDCVLKGDWRFDEYYEAACNSRKYGFAAFSRLTSPIATATSAASIVICVRQRDSGADLSQRWAEAMRSNGTR